MLRNNYPYLIKKPAENIEKHVTCSENQLLKVIFLLSSRQIYQNGSLS